MYTVGVKLIACSDGYYAIDNGIQCELKYGDLVTALSGIHIPSLKDTFLSCPYFCDSIPTEWEGFTKLHDWMKEVLQSGESPLIYNIIYYHIFNFIYDIFERKNACFDNTGTNDSFSENIKKHIFKDTDFEDYGDSNIGHLILTALCDVASSVVIANGALQHICDGKSDIVQDSITPEIWGSISIPCQFTSMFGEIQTVYTAGELDAVVLLELSKVCENKINVKKCQNCGKYFVPESRADEIYCGRISPQDPEMTCKKYGSKKLWYDKLKEDEIAKLSRNIYMAKQMLVKRNPDRPEYKEMLEFFKSERKKWQAQLKTGEKRAEEYTAWLNQMKAQKVLRSKNKPMEEV